MGRYIVRRLLIAIPTLIVISFVMYAILALAQIRDQITRYGFLPIDNRSVEGLQNFVQSEIARWAKVVHQAGIAGTE